MGRVRVGISGWKYAGWRGDFYPPGLVQKNELRFASRAFSSIEINSSFHALQLPERYENWAAQTPDDFVFSVKAPRFVTHVRRLKEVEQGVANFLASGIFKLGEKLGPILWQLPPSLMFDPELLETFLSLLPQDTSEAQKAEGSMSDWMQKRSFLETGPRRPMRHAIEVRHESFFDERYISLLRKYRVASVVADTGGRWPVIEDLTSDFVYLRLHGPREIYSSGYTDRALERWAGRILLWQQGREPTDARRVAPQKGTGAKSREVYCYFDNDMKGRAPFDARSLIHKLGLESGLSTEPGVMAQL